MKRFSTFFVMCLTLSCWFSVANAQTVQMPDTNLAAAVREALGLRPNAPITKQKLQKLTELYADYQEIENLTGLEHATQLEALDLSENLITDVSPLEELTNLKRLYLVLNGIQDVSPLEGLTNLEEFIIFGNPLDGIGPIVRMLEKNPNLEMEFREWIPMNEAQPPIYWITNDRVSKLRRLTNALADTETLEESDRLFAYQSLTTDTTAGKLYWIEEIGESRSEIKCANLDGDLNAQKLATVNGSIYDIAVDPKGRKLYWLTSPGSIQRADLNGKNIKTLVQNLEHPIHITVDIEAGQLYWVEWVEGFTIRRANLSGKNVQNVVTASSDTGTVSWVSGIAIAKDKIYWIQTERDAVKYPDWGRGGRLLRANLDGSNVEELIVAGYLRESSLAVDPAGESLYCTTPDSFFHNLSILRVDLNGANTEFAVFSHSNSFFGPNRFRIRKIAVGILPDSAAAAPVVYVAPAQRPPMYWIDTEAGTLHRLIGDEVEDLLPDVQDATSLAVDTTNNKLYWTEQTGKNKGSIKSANLDGSNALVLANIQNGVPRSIAVDPTQGKLYWTNSRGRIQRSNLNGKQIRNLIQDLESPDRITVNAGDGKLYWTENNGQIQRANLNGKSIQNIASGLETISGLAIVGNKIYWTEKTGESTGKVGRANLDGSNARTLASLKSAPSSIVIDPVGRKLYWAASGGSIRRANLNGKKVQNVVSGLSAPANIVLGSSPAATAAAPARATETPTQTALLANYPNPFNPETWIPYQLAKPSDVKITIYDTRGAVVRQLALGHQHAGTYTSRSRAAYWDGRNNQGERVASGIYFYQLQTDNVSSLRKMLILK